LFGINLKKVLEFINKIELSPRAYLKKPLFFSNIRLQEQTLYLSY